MLLGKFEEAWRVSEQIAARGKPDPHALWDGRPLAGKRVMIRCLHGYGDAIQFVRYAQLIRREARSVILQTHPELVYLLRELPYVDDVISWAEDQSKTNAWDQQLEVMELPRVFRTTLPTIPAAVPYLFVGEARRKRSLAALGTARGPRVGILWRASNWNPARSLPLSTLAPVLRTPGVSFYSFQRGEGRAELADCAFAHRIHDTAPHSPDIADTAADLLHMDLLVTVDTMAAHLAGALAKRVWMLLPYHADWRWMLDRRDSPWYPTMRLFRQPAPGDWHAPINEVARELAVLPWRAGVAPGVRAPAPISCA